MRCPHLCHLLDGSGRLPRKWSAWEGGGLALAGGQTARERASERWADSMASREGC